MDLFESIHGRRSYRGTHAGTPKSAGSGRARSRPRGRMGKPRFSASNTMSDFHIRHGVFARFFRIGYIDFHFPGTV